MKVPRLAMFNDLTGFGRCSTTVSLPVISAMQVQVCPVPTAIFSNHTGFPIHHSDDYTAHLREYLRPWKELGLAFDGIYCGFLGNIEQVRIVEEFLNDFQPEIFVLDPVMGDHGKPYSSISPDYCEKLKKLLSRATLIIPNLTEACLLTGTPYKEQSWTDYELKDICRKLAALCPGDIVITGLLRNSQYVNYIWQDDHRTTCTAFKTGGSRPGTGDLFASILVADALHHVELDVSVHKASDFVAKCIAGSEEEGVPVQEGVVFEKYLGELASL